MGVIQVTAKFDCVMQEHVHPPPLHKVSLTCILDTDFTQGPIFAKAVSVLRVAKEHTAVTRRLLEEIIHLIC